MKAVPIVKVSDIVEAESYYCTKLGFGKCFENSPGKDRNPAYIGLLRDGARIDISSFPGDGIEGSAVRLDVDNVDILFEEFSKKGVSIKLEPYDQSWGTREMLLDDPFGNKLRFTLS